MTYSSNVEIFQRDSAINALKTMGQRQRHQILRILAEHPEGMTNTLLSTKVQMHITSMYNHLHVLLREDKIIWERGGGKKLSLVRLK